MFACALLCEHAERLFVTRAVCNIAFRTGFVICNRVPDASAVFIRDYRIPVPDAGRPAQNELEFSRERAIGSRCWRTGSCTEANERIGGCARAIRAARHE